MIMRLETPLDEADAAQPIPVNTNPNYPSPDQPLRAYGFGLTEDGTASNYLREAQLTYISNDLCWGREISFNNVLKSDEVMCTDPFDDKTATCLGDSGGPLTDANSNSLVGVISFGVGCKADLIPDGHVRLSEVYDWIHEQMCLISANPPLDCAFTTKPRDPSAVNVMIDFTHDFYPEQTTYAITSKKTRKTLYAGPEYIPKRIESHEESIFLPPGEYTFDLYDLGGNGLVSPNGNGHWKLSAKYDGCTYTELASGGSSFKNQQATKFVVSERTTSYNDKCDENPYADSIEPINNTLSDTSDITSQEWLKCSDRKDLEETSGQFFSTTCDCRSSLTTGKVELLCKNKNGDDCAHNHQTCKTTSECCSGRKCLSGHCRSNGPVTSGRDSQRIGDRSVGGAAARSSRRHGNLRRR